MIRCHICHGFAVMIVWAKPYGWHKPSCLTCWPSVDILKGAGNMPMVGELVWL